MARLEETLETYGYLFYMATTFALGAFIIIMCYLF